MPSLIEFDQVILDKKIFKEFIKVISLFRNYLPGAIFCTIFHSIHEMMLYAKIGRNLSSGSGEEEENVTKNLQRRRQ